MANTKLDINKALDIKSATKNIEKIAEAEAKIRKNAAKAFANDKEKAEKEAIKAIAKYQQDLNKKTHADRMAELKEEFNTSMGYQQKLKTAAKAAVEVSKNALGKAVNNGISSINSNIEAYLGAYSKYMTGIETRLQGSTKSFSSITSLISRNVGASQYISQSKVLENLSKLVSEGISYNVEQRAFLATVSDKIADTFNAFDSNLAQIIRIQQADSTAARLGLESYLTKFFNRTFGDTSYLSTMFDTVSASLLGAQSQLGRDAGLEFEYTAQKWLGSLSSVGVSESTISALAQGLNYLVTGDISSLASNQSLQRLLVASAARAGVDYANALTGGLSVSDANKLLSGVVQLGQDLAKSNNQVVKSQYANLFGMTIADMTALLNLSSQDLVNISKNMLDYSKAVNETENQIKTIGSRMTIADRVETMFGNIMSSVGENIANSATGYTTWLITDMVEKATGGITDIELSPWGIGISTTVTQLIKTGIVGLATISEIGSILAGLSGMNTLSLDRWNSSEFNTHSRGSGFSSLVTTGVSRTTSQTAYVGSSDDSAIYEGSIAAGKEQSETVTGEESNAVDELKQYTLEILTALNNVINGSESFNVKMDGGYFGVGQTST